MDSKSNKSTCIAPLKSKKSPQFEIQLERPHAMYSLLLQLGWGHPDIAQTIESWPRSYEVDLLAALTVFDFNRPWRYLNYLRVRGLPDAEDFQGWLESNPQAKEMLEYEMDWELGIET